MKLLQLLVTGTAALAATAPALASVQISSNPTHNMNCAAGVCTATKQNADLNASDLAGMLASGDVKVMTGAGAVTITVSAPFSWTSTSRLTLEADLNVSFKAPVAVAGQGAVTVITKHDGHGGDLLFFPGGKLDFWGTTSNFTFNGKSHALVNDIAAVAAAYDANNNAVTAFAKDYDAGPDGTYPNFAVPSVMNGTFEGLGHTISNYKASGNDREAGFFSQSTNGLGVIRDFTLTNVHVTGAQDSLTGALGGALNADIINVHASGDVTAGKDSSVGGLVGYGGRFVNSDSSADVTCSTGCEAGGLVGFGGQFTLSHATGTVTVGGRSNAGGLVGLLGASSISQSYATGNVVSKNPEKSGALGGLVGTAIQNSTISDSYALGAVNNTGESAVGGLIGFAQDNVVSRTYAIGSVGSGAAPRSRGRFAGGFLGFADYVDDYVNDYWDVDTSGMTDACGGGKPKKGCPKPQGLSDAQLKAHLPDGFSATIWGQNAGINNGYPYLIANPPE